MTSTTASPIPPQISSFRKSSRLILYGSVTTDDFDVKVDNFYKNGDPNRGLLIDFQDAEFIEIAVLVNCISLFTLRTRSNQKSFIAYPKDKRVRDFLIVWRFSEAIQDATQTNISNFLVIESQRFLNESPDSYTGIGGGLNKLEFDSDWNPSKTTNRNFFEFTTFKDDHSKYIDPTGRLASAPRQAGKKWTSPLIQQILEKHLPGGTTKDEIARVIIYEAMSNAVRHPQATLIQAVSRFMRPKKVRGKITGGSLRICLWDDGNGIAQTLLEALEEERPIRAFQLPSYMSDKVLVRIRNFKEEIKGQHVIDQNMELPLKVSEPRMLLLSLSPGITRSLKKEVAKVVPYEENPKKEDDISDLMSLLGKAPGMGLYALTRTALDQFNGSLLIRSGRYRLIIEMAHDAFRIQYGVRYKCKITQYEKYVPPFLGNLLVVHLPIPSFQSEV